MESPGALGEAQRGEAERGEGQRGGGEAEQAGEGDQEAAPDCHQDQGVAGTERGEQHQLREETQGEGEAGCVAGERRPEAAALHRAGA